MLITLSINATTEQINNLYNNLAEKKLNPQVYQIDGQTVISVEKKDNSLELVALEAMGFVEKVIPITKPYKLVSKEYKNHNTVIKVGDVEIGSGKIQIIAGPCAVESKEQIMETAFAVKEAGATILRGGAFKPRTSPYSFQGLGEEGLIYLAEAGRQTGLPVITEIMDIKDIELVCKYADILQIGSRNMQNYSLLRELAAMDKPVMLKRGLAATLEEWLLAAEYLMAGGNSKIILCERGIRTFETHTRNTLDLSAVPAIKELSHLPIFVDPSHGTGKWKLVKPMAKAAVAAGADGLMLEVHPQPSQAYSDGEQSLTPNNFKILMEEIKRLAAVL
ncbi:MAG: 3-deoxy-7-phosphoheptulonate synthase [Clostridia bacterium]|nr:3-deoxy-7-phosphoheptulonate synthase [Clostridia bacterium]